MRPKRIGRTAAAVGLALGLFAGTACEDDESGLGPSFWALQEARHQTAMERWNERAPARYTFEYRKGCFCDPHATTSVRITVEGDQIVEAVYLEDVPLGEGETIPAGDPVPPEWVGAFPTIDRLLANVGREIQRRPVEFHVEYSPEFGHPVLFEGMSCRCPDAGWSDRVSAFEPLAP